MRRGADECILTKQGVVSQLHAVETEESKKTNTRCYMNCQDFYRK